MEAKVLHGVLESAIDDTDDGRDYLGMSQIGKCPRRLYFDLVEGREAQGAGSRRRCHEGLVHEADVIARIEAEGVPVINRGRELSADFDGRYGCQFLGHIDGEIDGDLLEIKSVEGRENLHYIRRFGPRVKDKDQCQAYMRWGGYYRTLIVYKARADGSTWVHCLDRDDEAGELLERKARKVLQAIDDGEPPACECGFCQVV